MNNFQRGDLTGIVWMAQVQGGFAQAVALPVVDQDLDLTSLLLDVYTVLSGGVAARLASKLDGSATINALYDADQSPYLAVPNINPGAGGLLLFAITVGSTRNLQVPMRIEKVHWKSGRENAVSYSFDVKIDSRVGTLVYPPA